MSNEIVKYHNDMNKVALNGFNKLELDLYAAIVSRMRNEGLGLISFEFDYLKELIKWKDTDNTKFVKTLRSMYRKLLNCTFAIENKNMIIEFVLFTRYRIDLDNKKIDIKVNKEFEWILNNLKLSFTRFELEEYVEIKSTYVKKFYMNMKQFRTTGIWKVSMEEFRRLLDVPANYKTNDIDKRILTPITEELKEKYGVYVLKKYDNKKRGRPSVSGFEFTFIKDIIDNGKNSKRTSDDEYKWEYEESTYDRLQREKREREGYQEPEIEDDPNDNFPF